MPNDTRSIEAIALLDEPARRRLYDWVATRPGGAAVSRDEAAVGAGVSRALAAFHLDRLAHAGLLAVEYRRLTGRSGPGAGRPAKLYRRAATDIGVSLPDRHYALPADLFAIGLEGADGEVPPPAVAAAARRAGAAAGRAALDAAEPNQPRETLLATLAARGYQPRVTSSGEIRLGNCPFHALVEDHRALVCGTNLAICQGLLGGLGEEGYAARLDPQPDSCCVALAPVAPEIVPESAEAETPS